MKLRGKKTGEIIELKLVQVHDKYLVDREVNFLNGEKLTLKLLIDNFDDVEEEPLIKDEKVRKAVRAWAEVNTLNELQYDKCEDCLYSPYGSDKTDTSVSISFDKIGIFKNLEHRRVYTVTELCGEVEE